MRHHFSQAILRSACAAAALCTVPVRAADFDPKAAFAAQPLPDGVNVYRSSNGAPGPGYWQNRVDYAITARIDATARTLTATETVDYTNNSPDALPSLWMQLDQNIYRADSRAAVAGGRRKGGGGQHSDGYAITSVEMLRGKAWVKIPFVVSDTRINLRLDQPLKGGGTKLKFRIAYQYAIPGVWGGRNSWLDTPNGTIFDIAQWFPRMAVYDDLRGWDTLPYLGSEFYCEYGDVDYAVTVPADMIVAGGGVLTNAAEVLTPLQRARLAKAAGSDATVMIRTPEEVTRDSTRPAAKGEKTWRYHFANTRDVAFSASRAFVWDAARMNLPGGKTALAESVYPIESAGDAGWGRSTEYLKDSVEHFSRRWFTYPYPTAWSIAGGSTGMEYPGMAFDGIPDKGKELFWITAHEIGHTWYPMVVGSNERRDAWMDEGFNTFIDTFESDEFKNGVFGPKRDSEYAPGGGNPVDEILPLLADRDAPPIMSYPDVMGEKYRHSVSYFKTALGLRLLRDVVLGPDRFDPAFRKYTADWAFKHPSPSDFFREMSSESGEDLSWFWRGWFFNNWQLDLAVTNIAYTDGDPAKGASITLESRDKLVMPAVLEVKYADGHTTRIKLPVETWMRIKPVIAAPAGRISSVMLDPDHLLPDRDRSNNGVVP
ncbi:M1 family metallopeptidase [Sphingomonas sp. AR_OL41]|uniref:M1 family metallopeptidase n=1 Tax=Sphingomonas sp. AR_OL41 TaxID=3042729 RepID=UPI00247FE2DE|nr:M1 family metallopeptidase [Sphingomonas sp. AR_OL41]MDH7975851.1 M1 family metallopeptidase [Sphingomonas sp. AR_OL41]